MIFHNYEFTAPAGSADSEVVPTINLTGLHLWVKTINGHNITIKVSDDGTDWVTYGSVITTTGIVEISVPCQRLKLSSTAGTGTAACGITGWLASSL